MSKYNCIKDITDVNNVTKGFVFWRNYFRDKLMTRVIFGNLPESLPSSELWYRIINQGFACVFNWKEFGTVTATGEMSGVDIYNHPTMFTFGQAKLGSGRLQIGKDCAIITATKEFWFTRYRLQDIIDRYARLMADIDASLEIATVNTRMQNVFTGIDTKTTEEVKRVIESIRNGTFDVAVAPSMIETIKSIPFNQKLDGNTLNDMLTLKDNMLKAFWSELGVNYVARKTERYTSAEIGANNGLLTSNGYSIIIPLQEGCDRINAVCGTNITVNLIPTELPADKGDEEYAELYQR